MNKNSITPKRLRFILATSIALVIALSAGGFLLIRNTLVTYAQEVSAATKAASISASDVTALEKLEVEMNENTVGINRAKNIVADSQHYQYQNQIINDLNTYAKNVGLSIASYSFLTDNAAAGVASPAPAPNQGATAQATPLPAGLKTTGVSVTLEAPASYTAVMSFIHLIERNLTKMQLSGISLTADRAEASTSQGTLSVAPLNIEVYIK